MKNRIAGRATGANATTIALGVPGNASEAALVAAVANRVVPIVALLAEVFVDVTVTAVRAGRSIPAIRRGFDIAAARVATAETT